MEIHYAIVKDTILGDAQDEAIIEIRPENDGWIVSSAPVRDIKSRSETRWLDEVGNPKFYVSFKDAKSDLENHWGRLEWCTKKINPGRPTGGQLSSEADIGCP